MTEQPTGPDLVQQTVTLSRTVAVGRATRDEAELLVSLGRAIAHRASDTFVTSQQYRHAWDDPAAIKMMNAVGNAAIVMAADEVRAALAERPGMAPELYLRSLGLAALPAWPLPDDDASHVIVFRRSGVGFGDLWRAIGDGDEAEIDRVIGKVNEYVLGPSGFWARSLGD
ncbi:hypothetical protein ABT025_18735 [Streptomyces sp. NPDC002809]|uniref:hypothetical protein n=1 Tax=Streptomyces sp. NPDC002809 TaxID=3154433 RepID=UPI0033309C19